MNRFVKLTLAGVLIGCTSSVLGQSQDMSPTAQVNRWCSAMVSSKGTTLLSEAMAVSSLVLEQKPMISAVESQQALVVGRYGAPLSCETLDVDKVGARFERHRILLHHQKYASTWEFSFYRTSSSWELTNFWFRDQVLPKKDRSEEQP